MSTLAHEVFICLDCETTGLDPKKDRVIELAASKFSLSSLIDSYETLINPECEIPQSSIDIHHISKDMLLDKPKIETILPMFLSFIKGHIIIGHGIQMDLSFLEESAKRHQIPFDFSSITFIDTLRLARLYGESPTNSLEKLRQHFNIEPEGAHRAMSDVIVNIEVFKHLITSFKTTNQILERLKKPILLKAMPLGKYKGRPFKDIPLEYLSWAAKADFDQDLLFSIRSELKRRKKGEDFRCAVNPFASLE